MRPLPFLSCRRLLALAALVPVATYAEDGAPVDDSVQVGDIGVKPFANLGGLDGRLRWHPKAAAGVAYDSNVLQVESDEEDDVLLTGILGLDLRYWTGQDSDLKVDAELNGKDYQDFNDRDQIGADITVDWTRRGPVWEHRVDGRYERLDDPLVETGRRIERQRLGAGYRAERAGNANRYGLAAGIDYDDYLEDGSDFDEDERDRWSPRASGSWSRTWAEGKDLLVRAGYGGVLYLEDDTERYRDSHSIHAQAGVALDNGNRLQLTALGGVKVRSFEDEFAQDPAYDDELVIGPMLEATLRYRTSERGSLSAGLRSDVVDGAGSNAATIIAASVGGEQRLGERWRTRAGAGYDWRRNSGAAAGEDETEATTLLLTAGVDYLFIAGFALGARASWRDYDSNRSGDDYQQGIISLAGAVAF
jgi:Putative beta-barrel porin 2